jgi:pimeloyl-ACP methyl ester carboxylesterase
MAALAKGDGGRKPLARASIDQALSAVIVRHRDARYPFDRKHPVVARTWRGISNTKTKTESRRQARPLLVDDLRAMVSMLRPQIPAEARDGALLRVTGPVVLVGHSYGGTLITHAGMDDRVAALVYIAALAPDETEISQGQQEKFPITDVLSHIEVADGRIWLKPDGVSFFCGDLPKAEQKLVWATQSVPVPDLFTQKLDSVAWRRKPSWFIVSSQDRTVQPELQRSAAKRMSATTVELRPSHVSMLSQPQAVVEVIRNAAAAVAPKRA